MKRRIEKKKLSRLRRECYTRYKRALGAHNRFDPNVIFARAIEKEAERTYEFGYNFLQSFRLDSYKVKTNDEM